MRNFAGYTLKASSINAKRPFILCVNKSVRLRKDLTGKKLSFKIST